MDTPLLREFFDARDQQFDPGEFDLDSAVKLPPVVRTSAVHRALLEKHNGMYSFGRALHIYGCAAKLTFHDLPARNADAPWRQMYGASASGIAFFAEDVFGNQYGYNDNSGVVFFDAETGDSENVAADLDGWLRYVLHDIDYTTGRSLAIEWQATHGPIPFGSHLCAKKPFVVGGDFAVENLYALPWDKSLAARADLARQIRELPDGTPIEFKVVE